MSELDLINTVQLQSVGDALVELFDLVLPSGNEIHLHNGLEQGTDSIYFSNKAGTVLNEYVAIPIEIDGIELNSDGPQSRPTLSLANLPTITRSIASNEDTMLDILEAEGVARNDDLINTKVTYRRTLLKYTQSSGAAAALPTEFPTHTYYIDRVSSESNIVVQFELASPMDIEGVVLPNRLVVGKYCSWRYQGVELASDGGCTWPLDGNGRFFTVSDSSINISATATWSSDNSSYVAGDRVQTDTNGYIQVWEAVRTVPLNKEPSANPIYWERVDLCGKLLNSCKIRFQGNNSNTNLDTSTPLPFGAFPGTKKFR